jgi:hypothetical protein
MKKYLLIIIFVLLFLAGCQSSLTNDNSSETIEESETNESIDYELLSLVLDIKNALNRISDLNSNKEITLLTTKLETTNNSSLFLDEERLIIFNQHFNLLERIVLDGYISGSEIEGKDYITEDDSFFYYETLISLKISINRIDNKIQSNIISEVLYDEIIYYHTQVIGELIDNELYINVLYSQDNNYFYEEFVENKGMLTLVYEPDNSDQIHIENIFLVPYNPNTKIVVFYYYTLDQITEIHLTQLIYDDENNLVYELGSYDPLDYIIQIFEHIEDINNQITDDMLLIEDKIEAISEILLWHIYLKFSNIENLIDYIILEERFIPILDFDKIKQRVSEDLYINYLTYEIEYSELINKEDISLNEVIRILEIGSYFLGLGLSEDEVIITKYLYPVIDYDSLYDDIIDEFGLSKTIYYTDDLIPIDEVDKVIRENHTYVKENIELLINDYGSHYGVDSKVITSIEFFDYLISLGFLIP